MLFGLRAIGLGRHVAWLAGEHGCRRDLLGRFWLSSAFGRLAYGGLSFSSVGSVKRTPSSWNQSLYKTATLLQHEGLSQALHSSNMKALTNLSPRSRFGQCHNAEAKLCGEELSAERLDWVVWSDDKPGS
jgi:hypothetical protein